METGAQVKTKINGHEDNFSTISGVNKITQKK